MTINHTDFNPSDITGSVTYLSANHNADPQFVSPLPAGSAPITGGDYHLNSASALIDIGVALYISGSDTLLNLSPTEYDGSAPDLGAFEFIAPVPELAVSTDSLNFGQVIDGETATDYSGNEMNGAPAWVSNAELKYTPEFVKGVRFRLEWQHVGKYFTDQANENSYGGYDVFNARMGYKKGHWHLWADLLNVADKLYANRAETSWGKTTYTPGAPRTFNVGLEINLF